MLTQFFSPMTVMGSVRENINTLLLKIRLKTPDGDALTGLAEGLGIFSEALADVSRRAEPEFLQLSRQLQTAFSDASALAQATVATVRQIGTESGSGVLSQIDRIVQGALTALQSRKRQVDTDLDALAKGAGYLGDLHKECAVVEKMALELRVVGLNIGVESSRSIEARDKFGVVTTEIGTLSETIMSIAADIRNDAKSARNLQRSAHKEISRGIDELNSVTADAEQTVAAAAGEIKNLMALSIGAMDRAGVLFSEISRQVGEIVVGIQFHDNMHQRICHINEALGDVMALCRQAGADNPSPKKPHADLGRAHALVALQIAQLTQVISEVHDLKTQNTNAFDAIIERVGKLAQNLTIFDGASVPGQTADSRSSQITGPIPNKRREHTPPPNRTAVDGKELSKSSFLNLQAALKHFHGLLEESVQLHGRIRETSAQAGTAVARLSESAVKITRINFQIHIMALNAIVRSAHMGAEGRALEVLAQAVKDLSDQSNTFVATVNTMLGGIQKTAGAGENVDPRNQTVVSESGTAVLAMGEGIAQITDAYEKLRTDSADITRRAGMLEKALSATRKELEFLRALEQSLIHRLGELKAIGKVLQPWARDTDSPGDGRQLTDRYTMERERMVHETQLGSGTTRMDLIAAPAPQPDMPLDAATVQLPDTTGNRQDDNCELFSPRESAAPPDAATITEDKEDLGENIELF